MATWYAQADSANIDAAELWNSAADGSGSDLTWASLGASDVLVANAHTAIECNVSFTCGRITTSDADGGTAGGGFTCNLAAGANRTFAFDIVAGTTACLVISGTTYSFTLTGDVTGGSGTGCNGISLNTAQTPTFAVTGDVTGGTGSKYAYGISRGGNGHTYTVTGNLVAATAAAIQAPGASGVITVTGNITATNGMAAIAYQSGAYTVSCGGNLVCSADGTFPCASHYEYGVKIKLTGTASGSTLSMRDGTLTELTLKVPDYPLEADVETGVQYDYTTKTGTLAASGGGGPLLDGRLAR